MIHLLKKWVRRGAELTPYAWCMEGRLVPEQFVTEALFADCTACLEARSRAASAAKPAVIVPPYPVNPHG